MAYQLVWWDLRAFDRVSSRRLPRRALSRFCARLDGLWGALAVTYAQVLRVLSCMPYSRADERPSDRPGLARTIWLSLQRRRYRSACPNPFTSWKKTVRFEPRSWKAVHHGHACLVPLGVNQMFFDVRRIADAVSGR
jgi:hypothetical protein